MSDLGTMPRRATRCTLCGGMLTWEHDHKPDESGLDDGVLLPGVRRKAAPKPPIVLAAIRARAWATRRVKYGVRGHR